jgi:phage baseplate assembly protein W
MATPQQEFYSDLSYKPSLTQLGDVQKVINEDAIKQSIQTIMYTAPGSRLFEPTFGVGIEKYLFEEFSEATGATIGKSIENGLNRYEPRIALQSVEVSLLEADLSYNIAIQYMVIDTQTTDAVQVRLVRS